jgi:hypothetical protein
MQKLPPSFGLLERPLVGLLPVWLGALLCFAGCEDSTVPQPATSLGAAANTPTSASPAALHGDDALKARLDDVIAFTRDRHLDPQRNNAWQIIYGVLAYGNDLQLSVDGKLYPAVDWILDGGQFKGWNLVPAEKGVESIMDPGNKVGEGHEDQWIGYLSQTGVSLDHPVRVGDRSFKVRDMLTQAQWDMRQGMEATFTLMALAAYLPLDAHWKTKDGSEWTLDRVVNMEATLHKNVEQLSAESACGGTHRLYALATALNKYQRAGQPLKGGWLAAHEKVQGAIQAARDFQQPDGTLSVSFFTRSSSSPDIAARLYAGGHAFEFLSVAASDKELRAPWFTRALESLLTMLELTRDEDLECGALYHAAHGLRIYRSRRFGDYPLPGVTMPASSTTDQASSVQ